MKTATGSRGGTGWWLAQRGTAIVMLVAGLVLWFGFLSAPEMDFETWHALFQKTSTRLLVWLLVAGICLHAWIGLRDVLMDYVQPLAPRLLLNILLLLMLVFCVVWVTIILWGGHA